jgi:hypothetical protein
MISFFLIRKIVANEQLDTLNLAMCTGLTFECCQLLTKKLSLYVNNYLCWFFFYFIFKYF